MELASCPGEQAREENKTKPKKKKDSPVHWPLVIDFHDVFKSGSLQTFGTLAPNSETLAKVKAGLDDSLPPKLVEMIGPHGAVVGNRFDGMLHDFHVASRSQTIEAMTEKFVPIGNAAKHFPHVNEIELVGRIGPGEGHVVDFKDTIGGDKGGLDGREVDSCDFGTGVFIGHVTVHVSERDPIVESVGM